jgi:glycine C-acetyltransferase
MTEAGFGIRPGVHPIVPIMLYNAKLAQDLARDMYAEGIYVIGFFYPVVARGQARIRVQLSAAHEKEHIDKAIAVLDRKVKARRKELDALSKERAAAQKPRPNQSRQRPIRQQ